MRAPRKRLFAQLNTTLFRAIESATAFAKLRGNPYVEVAHWLHQIWQVPGTDLHRIAQHFDIDPAQLERDLQTALERFPTGASSVSDFSRHIDGAIERAWVVSGLTFQRSAIRGAALIAAMLADAELRTVLLHVSPSFSRIPKDTSADTWLAAVQGSSEDHDESTAAATGQAVDAQNRPVEISSAESTGDALHKYCSDLTTRAKAGEIDPVIGRDQEIRNMIDILLRRRQNNPLLTGEAGVGKTAVVEGLALALASGEVPPALHNTRLLSLDVGALLAGASMRGEFESRLKGVLQEAAQSPQPIILFVDEVHTLVGAGGQAGTGDAANLLKPALARGTLRTIGATTWSEYKRHIEKDPALTRRFQVLQIAEPEADAAIAMVRALVPTFVQHHHVEVLDEAVRQAVLLSQRYIPSRQLPDKAISLLDTACARVALSTHTPPAHVVDLSQQLHNLRNEQAMLANDERLGYGQSQDQQRLAQRIAECEAELEQARSAWQTEQAQVQRLNTLRALKAPSEQEQQERAALQNQRQAHTETMVHPQVDAHVVSAIVADWTGIPVGRMVQNEIDALLDLPAHMRARVVGQDAAISRISERVRTSRAGLGDPGKPVGVFLLVGPSGVGKTETALSLAETFFGGEHNLITINMSEFQEAHTVSSLKGAPPGYVGYGEGGVLTEAVRRRPYSVVLLDEVEKAHPDVHEIFYQVFDKGWMEDGEGRHIDFRNTLILLTSNVSSELITDACDDPALMPDMPTLADSLQPELRKVFPAAFVGRVTVVPYLALSETVLSDITELQLHKVAKRLQERHGAPLTWSEAARAHIVSECGTHEIGARRIGQFIERNVLPMLSEAWLQAMHTQQPLVSVHIDTVAESPAHNEALTREGLCFHVHIGDAPSSATQNKTPELSSTAESLTQPLKESL